MCRSLDGLHDAVEKYTHIRKGQLSAVGAEAITSPGDHRGMCSELLRLSKLDDCVFGDNHQAHSVVWQEYGTQVLELLNGGRLQQSHQLVKSMCEIVPREAWRCDGMPQLQLQIGDTVREQIVQHGHALLTADIEEGAPLSERCCSCPIRYHQMTSSAHQLPKQASCNVR